MVVGMVVCTIPYHTTLPYHIVPYHICVFTPPTNVYVRTVSNATKQSHNKSCLVLLWWYASSSWEYLSQLKVVPGYGTGGLRHTHTMVMSMVLIKAESVTSDFATSNVTRKDVLTVCILDLMRIHFLYVFPLSCEGSEEFSEVSSERNGEENDWHSIVTSSRSVCQSKNTTVRCVPRVESSSTMVFYTLPKIFSWDRGDASKETSLLLSTEFAWRFHCGHLLYN
jgi:hypothetical protein